MRNRILIKTLLCLALIGCSPSRHDIGAPAQPMMAADLATSPPDAAAPMSIDLGYICGRYSNYTAQVNGVVRSPCDYDVSKILSIGGNVQTKINPPTISMQFPDGTFFSGTTDGVTFTATRLTNFPFTDGCDWLATETMHGTIDAANDCTLNTTYTYREAPVSSGFCATPCTIDAQLIINWVSIIIG